MSSPVDESGGDETNPTQAKDVAGKKSNKKLENEKKILRKKFGQHVDVEIGPFNTRSYICKLCVITATSAHNLGQHFQGQGHQRKLQNDQIARRKMAYIKKNKNMNSEENLKSNNRGMSFDGPHSSKDLSSCYDPYVSSYREEGPSSAGPVRDWSHGLPPQKDPHRESPPMPPIIGPYLGKEYKSLEARSVERPAPYTKKRVAEQPPGQKCFRESDYRQPELHASSIQGINVDTEELMRMIENARTRCPTPPRAPSPEPAAPQGVMGTLFSTLENYTVNDKTSAQEALNIIHIFLKPIREYYMKMGDSKSVALASVAEINVQSLEELDIFR